MSYDFFMQVDNYFRILSDSFYGLESQGSEFHHLRSFNVFTMLDKVSKCLDHSCLDYFSPKYISSNHFLNRKHQY